MQSVEARWRESLNCWRADVSGRLVRQLSLEHGHVPCLIGLDIEPTKVVRIALENAVSVAGTLLLTDATLTDVPEAKREAEAPADALRREVGDGLLRRQAQTSAAPPREL